ncbi:MAG: class I SAM-dependent methyltransferase [bacterium]|nr:class I SAM-dependent methyltransferase [bacterium]
MMGSILPSIFRSVFAHPDNIRLVTQGPIIKDYLTCVGEVTPPLHWVIDVGCGTGRYTEWLTKKSDFVVGMDINWSGLERVKAKNIPVSLVQSVAEALPFKNLSFDFVLCTEVLEHIENDKLALKEMFRILMPGTSLLLSVPCPPPPYPDSAHKRAGYTKVDIISLLRELGFEPLTTHFCMFTISRLLLKFSTQFMRIFKFPPPVLPLVRLEKFLREDKGYKPFNLVILAKKNTLDCKT